MGTVISAGGEGGTIQNYTVTTRIILYTDGRPGEPFSCFIHCEEQSQDSVCKSQLLKRKESRSVTEPQSFCLPA